MLAHILSRQSEYIAFEEQRTLARDWRPEFQEREKKRGRDIHNMCDETFSTTDSSPGEACQGGGGESVWDAKKGEREERDGAEGEAVSSCDN